MTDEVLYDDGRVCLDAEAVTLRRYYFPLATSKRIPYTDIRNVEVRPMTWLTGKGRLWGTSCPAYWLPLDRTRPHKDTAVVLDLGRRIRPVFTPDAPGRVEELLRRVLG